MPTAFSGERIKTLRALFGLTQDNLARVAEVSQPLISQVELGRAGATEELLQAISAATSTPRSFFDVIPEDLPLGSLRFRKNATASRKETKRAEALFGEAHRVTRDLAERARYPKPAIPAAESAVDQADIERLAAETREALRLGPDGPIPHVTRALERSGIATVPLVLPTADDDDPDASATPGHFGMSYWAGPGAHALVGYFPGSKPDRDRFTLSHELAHLVLHTHRRASDPEEEANRFAGEFLMPRHQAKEIFSADLTLKDFARLKAIWGMSIQALIMRAWQCGRIDDARRRSLFIQLSARGWRKNEPVVMHPEEPLLTWRLLSAEFGASPYAAAVDKLALPPVILRSLVPQPLMTSKAPTGAGKTAASLAAVVRFDRNRR